MTRRRGASGDRGREAIDTGTSAPSPSVRSEILDVWGGASNLDASTLDAHLDVGGNSIVLTGDVGSYSDRMTAESLVEGIMPDVPAINRIDVRRSWSEPAATDATITARVRGALATAAPEAEVTVAVRDHVATLDGMVTPEERRSAHAVTARTPGVHFVTDQLEVF